MDFEFFNLKQPVSVPEEAKCYSFHLIWRQAKGYYLGARRYEDSESIEADNVQRPGKIQRTIRTRQNWAKTPTYMNHMQNKVAQMRTRCKLEYWRRSGPRRWDRNAVRNPREKQTFEMSVFWAFVRLVGARSKEAQHHSQEECDKRRNNHR